MDTFDQMNLKESILRGIYAYGFEKPSLIQQKAIVPLIAGEDLIAQSQSGTGKTATAGCPFPSTSAGAATAAAMTTSSSNKEESRVSCCCRVWVFGGGGTLLDGEGCQ
jgi:hypothetical protein